MHLITSLLTVLATTCVTLPQVYSQPAPAAGGSSYWQQRQQRSQEYLRQQYGQQAANTPVGGITQPAQQQQQQQASIPVPTQPYVPIQQQYNQQQQQQQPPPVVPIQSYQTLPPAQEQRVEQQEIINTMFSHQPHFGAHGLDLSGQQQAVDQQQATDPAQDISASGTFALRHSFAAPFANHLIPFWVAGAGATIFDDKVRLTPTQQGRFGYLWNSIQSEMESWSVTVEFSVNGALSGGADGFAFWYAEKPEMVGSVFGSTDYWTGLGIFFDTFNNDGIGRNPMIAAIYNDGTLKYDAATDGATQALATCPANFRNMPESAVAKISYQNRKLSVAIATRRDPQNNQPVFLPCLQVDDLELGIDKYFGLSARTGDLVDNHDIFSVITTDLSMPNVDLAAVRAQWKQTLAQQHEQSRQSQNQQPMTTEEFQSSVIQSLNQLSSDLNLMEISQLAISEWLHTKLDDGAVAVSGQPAIASSSSTAKLDAAQAQQLGTLHDQQGWIVQTLQSMSQQLSNMPAPALAAAPPAANTGTNNFDTAQVLQAFRSYQQTTESQFRTTKDTINALQRKIDDLLVSAGKLSSLQSTSSSSSGWLSTGFIGVTAAAALINALLTFRSSRAANRYKLV